MDYRYSYNYARVLRDKGYLVLTVADFTLATFFNGFQKALCIADYYNTRLFAVSHSHGLPTGGFTTYDVGAITAHSFVAFLDDPKLVSNSRLDALGLSYMKGKLNGGILEIVYYIASCFALGGYGEVKIGGIYTTSYQSPLSTYASKGAVLGVFLRLAQFSDVSDFRYYFLARDQNLKTAYDNACWTSWHTVRTWGSFSSTNYRLPEM